MNKVNLSPFVIPSFQNKEVSPTPRLLSKSRKTNSHINKLRNRKRQQCMDSEENFHFDDTFCFRECNNTANSDRIINNNSEGERKKCKSQILAVKLVDTRVGEKAHCSYDTFRTGNRTVDTHQFDIFATLTLEIGEKRGNFTSQSNRKRQYLQHQSERVNANASLIDKIKEATLGTSALIPKKLQYHSEPYSPGKPRSKERFIFDPSSPLKVQRESVSGTSFKKSNFLKYSIIKPEEIKSLGLLIKRQEKTGDKKKKDQRALYHQLMLQVKSKKEILREKEEKKLKRDATYRARQVGKRVGVHSSAAHRQTFNTIERDESLEPWQFQNTNDIL